MANESRKTLVCGAVAPVVRLPTNDIRRPERRCHDDLNQALPASTSTTELGNNQLTTTSRAKQQANSITQPRNIIVNIPRLSSLDDSIDMERSSTRSLSTPGGRSGGGHPNSTTQEARDRFQQRQLSEVQARPTHIRQVNSSLTSTSPPYASSRHTSPKQHAAKYDEAFDANHTLIRERQGEGMDNRYYRSFEQYHSVSVETGKRPQYYRQAMSQPTGTPHYGSRFSNQSRNGGLVARRQGEWQGWVEVRVRVFGLTSDITTADLWYCFSKEGSITTIEIFEDTAGNRNGKACIRFSPPPATAFWQANTFPVEKKGTGVVYVRLELEPAPRTFLSPSPVDSTIKYPEVMIMTLASVDFGIMYDQETMMSMYTAQPTKKTDIIFRQSMLHREIVIEMTLEIRDPRPVSNRTRVGKYNRDESIRFSIPFSQLELIHQVHNGQDRVVFLISLGTPPRFYRKVDESVTHEDSSRFWTERDAWYRQTDIIYDHGGLRNSPLALKKTKPIIDIGRWTTYRLVFDMSRNNRPLFNRMCQALRDHNVEFKPFRSFKLIKDLEPAVWEYIDNPVAIQRRTGNLLEELAQDVVPQLSFAVRFQLEVCISHGFLNEHSLTQGFVTRLIAMEEAKAQDVLEYVANQKKRIWEPMQIFSFNVTKGSACRTRIPYYCASIRSATVTPTTVYFNTPTVDTSNRIIRQYAEYADRFLRVRFTDEKSQGRIFPTDKNTMDEVFTRIFRAMKNGISIGDRHYEFLAFGNSQFREHGAYFFAPLQHLTAKHIRNWMGKFSDIKVVAKHAARLGQCFSTTRAINCTKVTVVEDEDIQRNGYMFSDGVGKISPMLAQLAASELGLSTLEPPSVFQFRLGGCKGVLAVSPEAVRQEVHIRPSQYKFPAMHEGLEIIRWSQMASANLNRQLILVLSALGVPDEVFIGKLKNQLASLEQAMREGKTALALLQKDVDPNQMTLCIAGMVIDGFQKTEEPFLVSLLHLWRAWSIKYLKEKARLTITDGALLIGCLDETATLKGHYNNVSLDQANTREEKELLLPEVFVQISQGPQQKPRVILGPMLLARNPSLHPGDIRVVRGVDVPSLRHLRDAVVLPQTGDRDIASMCSGGDLDGDDFLVMWDQDLLPQEWNHEPMNYTAPQPLTVEHEVEIEDITSFFVTYMKNDTLPTIAQAHVAQADYLDNGIKDKKCLELAALHSTAVDYVKSGIPARITRDLRPRKWPHFMEKKYKPKEQQYVSKKILGQLFDQVNRVDFVPTFGKPFDNRVLDAYELDPDMLRAAAEIKQQYDAAIRRIMAQHDIKTEFEVWSTFVMHHSHESRDFKFHEEIGRLSQALKDQFREECRVKANKMSGGDLLPFVAAMYYVTAEEMELALSECRQTVMVGGVETPLRKMIPSSMPLMSFPWLFPQHLGRIANRDRSEDNKTATVALQGDKKRDNVTKRKPQPQEGDLLVETTEGTTHQGQELKLFEDLIDIRMDEEQQSAEPKAGSGISSDWEDIGNDLAVALEPSKIDEPTENTSIVKDDTEESEEDDDDEHAEDVEIRIEARPSYIDRLSAMD